MFSEVAWGTPLLLLLLGGGLFFTVYSRFLPFKYLKHAIDVLRGKYDKDDDPGDINHYQALASAVAATVGMGNISGVAVAITTGGPGALVWMWLSAVLGISTKFFTCSLAIMYRGKDSAGHLEGGPMYVVREGLGPKWKALAVLFCVAGLFGCLPVFQANQLTQVIRDLLLIPNGWMLQNSWFEANLGPTAYSDFLTGTVIMLIVATVTFGGLHRIANVAGKLVPFMVLTYILIVLYILITNISEIPASFALIFSDAFTGKAVLGGLVGEVIRQGARRAAFSNEAGIGTAPMMHGAAKTKEPIREGLVAMLGPAIDTLLVCTMTALAIIVTGVWDQKHKLNIEVLDTQGNPVITGKIYTPTDEEENNADAYPIIYTSTTLLDNIDYEQALGVFHLDSLNSTVQLQLPVAASEVSLGTIRLVVNTPFKSYKKHQCIATASMGAFQLEGDHTLKGALSTPGGFYQSFVESKVKNGVTLTATAFQAEMSTTGILLLGICAAVFAFSTLFSFSYYGAKCSSFLFGSESVKIHRYFYVLTILWGAVVSIDSVINLIDGMYALMAIPTMVSALLLSPKVLQEARKYFEKYG
ncbi:alanine/glycine:cation symporter family protein [Rapidithrix thailandica]|uniref:Alanine/glycine:cation symporter family protein n=1 Tax=Rapidithrix thailandica TaxID=413964 RepID=A0AAW9S054_9BACT